MTQLIRYEAACRAIAEAKQVDEVKDLADKAEAMRVYARQAQNRDMEVDAAEIRIRAERRLGEMIAEQKATTGLAKPGPRSVVANDRIPTLADAGISKDLSSRAQKLAELPPDKFEGEVAAWREKSLTDARVSIQLAKPVKPSPPVTPERKPRVMAPPENDAGIGLDDVISNAEHVERQNRALQEQIKAIAADDPRAELAKQIEIRQALESQHDRLMQRQHDTAKEATRLQGICQKLRGLLNVETNSQIVPAVQKLLNRREAA